MFAQSKNSNNIFHQNINKSFIHLTYADNLKPSTVHDEINKEKKNKNSTKESTKVMKNYDTMNTEGEKNSYGVRFNVHNNSYPSLGTFQHNLVPPITHFCISVTQNRRKNI